MIKPELWVDVLPIFWRTVKNYFQITSRDHRDKHPDEKYTVIKKALSDQGHRRTLADIKEYYTIQMGETIGILKARKAAEEHQALLNQPGTSSENTKSEANGNSLSEVDSVINEVEISGNVNNESAENKLKSFPNTNEPSTIESVIEIVNSGNVNDESSESRSKPQGIDNVLSRSRSKSQKSTSKPSRVISKVVGCGNVSSDTSMNKEKSKLKFKTSNNALGTTKIVDDLENINGGVREKVTSKAQTSENESSTTDDCFITYASIKPCTVKVEDIRNSPSPKKNQISSAIRGNSSQKDKPHFNSQFKESEDNSKSKLKNHKICTYDNRKIVNGKMSPIRCNNKTFEESRKSNCALPHLKIKSRPNKRPSTETCTPDENPKMAKTASPRSSFKENIVSSMEIETPKITKRSSGSASKESNVSLIEIESQDMTHSSSPMSASKENNLTSSMKIGTPNITKRTASRSACITSNESSIEIESQNMTKSSSSISSSKENNESSMDIVPPKVMKRKSRSASKENDVSSIEIETQNKTKRTSRSASKESNLSSMEIESPKMTNKTPSRSASKETNVSSSVEIQTPQMIKRKSRSASKENDASSIELETQNITMRTIRSASKESNVSLVESETQNMTSSSSISASKENVSSMEIETPKMKKRKSISVSKENDVSSIEIETQNMTKRTSRSASKESNLSSTEIESPKITKKTSSRSASKENNVSSLEIETPQMIKRKSRSASKENDASSIELETQNITMRTSRSASKESNVSSVEIETQDMTMISSPRSASKVNDVLSMEIESPKMKKRTQSRSASKENNESKVDIKTPKTTKITPTRSASKENNLSSEETETQKMTKDSSAKSAPKENNVSSEDLESQNMTKRSSSKSAHKENHVSLEEIEIQNMIKSSSSKSASKESNLSSVDIIIMQVSRGLIDETPNKTRKRLKSQENDDESLTVVNTTVGSDKIEDLKNMSETCKVDTKTNLIDSFKTPNTNVSKKIKPLRWCLCSEPKCVCQGNQVPPSPLHTRSGNIRNSLDQPPLKKRKRENCDTKTPTRDTEIAQTTPCDSVPSTSTVTFKKTDENASWNKDSIMDSSTSVHKPEEGAERTIKEIKSMPVVVLEKIQSPLENKLEFKKPKGPTRKSYLTQRRKTLNEIKQNPLMDSERSMTNEIEMENDGADFHENEICSSTTYSLVNPETYSPDSDSDNQRSLDDAGSDSDTQWSLDDHGADSDTNTLIKPSEIGKKVKCEYFSTGMKPLVQKDDLSIFGEMVVEDMRKLSKKNILLAKNKIQNILFDLQMQELSGISNSSTSTHQQS